jgi:hypothetical protein
MRLAFLVLAITSIPLACGGRSELFELSYESSVDAGAPRDAARDHEVRHDAGHDAAHAHDAHFPKRDAMCSTAELEESCPLAPPKPGQACCNQALQCAYITTPDASPDGLEGRCCSDDGWYDCTDEICWCSMAPENTERCYNILCTPGLQTECIIGQGQQCCVCSEDRSVDKCGPCGGDAGKWPP